MKITIKITKEILERSKFCGTGYELDKPEHQCSNIASNCAFALAVREIAPKAIVDCGFIYWDGKKTYSQKERDQKMMSRWSEDMTDFIINFDSCSAIERVAMEEKSFETEIPDAYIDSIGIDQALEIISNSPTLEMAV